MPALILSAQQGQLQSTRPLRDPTTVHAATKHSLDGIAQVLSFLSKLLHPSPRLGRRTLGCSRTARRLLPPRLELGCCLG